MLLTTSQPCFHNSFLNYVCHTDSLSFLLQPYQFPCSQKCIINSSKETRQTELIANFCHNPKITNVIEIFTPVVQPLLHCAHPVWELHVAQRLSRHRRRQPRQCAGAHCCGEQGADQAESPPLVISADDLRQWCFLFRRRKKARRRRLERDCRFVKKFRLLILELGKDFQWDVFAGEAAC